MYYKILLKWILKLTIALKEDKSVITSKVEIKGVIDLCVRYPFVGYYY